MAGPNDSDILQGRNATPQQAQQMAQDLNDALRIADEAFKGIEKNLQEAVVRNQTRLATLQEEYTNLQMSGRDVFGKNEEILREQKKMEIAQSGMEKYARLMTTGNLSNFVEAARSSGDSVQDAMGAAYTNLMDMFDGIAPKEVMDKIKQTLGTKFSELKTKEEKDNFAKVVAETIAGLAGSGKDIAAVMEKMKGFDFTKTSTEIQQLQEQTKILMTRFTGMKDEGKSFFQLLSNNGAQGLNAVAMGMKAVLTPANLMAAGMTKLFGITKKLVLELDELYAGYAKMGGMIEMDRGGIMGGALDKSISQGRGLGIGKEASFAAGAGLYESYAEFSNLNEDARADLMAFTAQLEQVGVSAQTTGKLMNIMTRQFGSSVEGAKADIAEMEEYGRSIGVTSSKMMNDMLASMEVLSMYGEKSKQIFKELARDAKKAGIEVGVLVGLEEKFTTFENSAQLAGTINSMAGRIVLDPMQLMMATGDEKMALMRQAGQALAVNGNPRAMKYAANAFGMSTGDFQKWINPQDEPDRQATSLQEVIKMSISLGQKLKTVMERLAPAVMPFLWILQQLMSLLMLITSPLDTFEGKVFMIGVGALILASRFSLLFSLGKGLFSVFGSVAKGLFHMAAAGYRAAAGLVASAFGMKSAQTASVGGGAAAGGMTAFATGLFALSAAAVVFAVAADLLAIAFTIFAVGIYILVKAANELKDGAMWELGIGLVILGASFIAFAVEMSIASGFLLFAAPALISLGVLLGVLALTVPAVAPLMSDFAEGLRDLGSAFRDFMGSMVMESGSGVWNSIKGFFGMKSSGNGFGFFIQTMRVLKDTLGGIPEGALDAFASFLKVISSFVFKASPFAAMVASIKEMVSLLKDLPDEKLISLTSNLQTIGESAYGASAFQGVLEAAGSLTEEKVALIKEVVSTAKDYYSSTNEFAKVQAEAPKKQEEQRVTLEIDGREMADAIIPLIEGRLAASYFQDTLYK